MEKPKGVGIHVFAGGFTMGVKQVLPVVGQLEIHNFGRHTCESHGTKFMNANTWREWEQYNDVTSDCQFCYGNPRCTAFSCYSAGHSREVRGPTAKPTQDIWDLCQYGIKHKLELICFESVQQAYTVGKQLLNILRDDLFIPNGYRIAHLFVNTAAEGNAQKRRRYFFVAYKDNHNFNVVLPKLPEYRVTVGDILGQQFFENRPVYEGNLTGKCNVDYTMDTFKKLSKKDKAYIPYLKQGECAHSLVKRDEDLFEQICPEMYEKWITRVSNIPFSLHAPVRLKWNGHCPTIASTSRNLIHPIYHRPLTIGEIAALMGWPLGFIPAGPDPVGQIGKGVVPATGKWLAEQIKLYFENYWGNEDFESTYYHHRDTWVGKLNVQGAKEKVFNLTHYLPTFKESHDVC